MPHKESKEGWISTTEAINLGLPKVSVSKKGVPWFFLERWRGKIGNELADQIAEESRKLGKEVHKLIEDRFNGIKEEGYTDNALRMVDNLWKKFIIPWEAKPVKLEQTVEDEALKLQGSYDGIIRTNKGIFVVDWKTSNSLDEKGGPLQLCCYNYLTKENINRGVMVRIDKETDEVKPKIYENLPQYWPQFLRCMGTARYIRWGEV